MVQGKLSRSYVRDGKHQWRNYGGVHGGHKGHMPPPPNQPRFVPPRVPPHL